MKKILLYAGLLAGLLMLVLSISSCGFTAAGGLEIERISAVRLDDGSGATRITIEYFDDVEDPLVFDIPMGLPGEKGDTGAEGNGIKGIVITNSEDGNTKNMEILYTDPNMESTVVSVQNGVSIVSANREDVKETVTNEDGEEVEVTVAYMVLTLSNGSTQRVKLPEGVQGTGIATLRQDIDPATGETIVEFVLDNGNKLTPIRIQPGARGKSIDRVMTEDWVEDGKKLGLTLKFYLENTDQPLASVNLREGIGLGDLKSAPIIVEGKKVGTRFYFEKTDGTVTDEIEVMDGVGIVNIVSAPQTDGSMKVTVYLSDGTSTDFVLPAAVSIRDITSEELQNGDVIITIQKTDGSAATFTVKKAVGIVNMEIERDDENEGYYIMKVTYSDGTTQDVPFAMPVAWLHGNGKPGIALGKNGDYYFDHENSVIYYKDDDSWQRVVDLNSTDDPVEVTFNIDPQLGEAWGYSTNSRTFDTLKRGESFATTGHTVPMPTKAPTAADLEAGITAYRFVGWATVREPSAVNGFFTDLTIIPGNLTLYPVWEAVY